ncbi:cubilin-like [Lytechinus variegatus]|uniref:cubilin-like n=1 Tax=Lytechinus variegatus TaxID=7654 RepID=UPI001BB2A367|nr:cubilin-like [Lytechinus variegatus]XP_041458356.1 cubilin-like [Lytechinus variegatus]
MMKIIRSCSRWNGFLAALLLIATRVGAEPRGKRAADSAEQPNILTNDGHLIFQTGSNHNISFKTGGGTGRINIDDYDLVDISRMAMTSKADVEGLQSDVASLQSSNQDLMTRVTNLENGSGGGGGTSPDIERRVSDLEENYNILTVDECSSNPCRNGGTCIDMYDKFMCLCTSAWQGNLCEQDFNECSVIVGTVNDCQNGGSCVNTQGGYRCDCTADFYGSLCTMQYDDCASNTVANVCDHGYCVNLPRIQTGVARFDCICSDGWDKVSASNPACSADIDECSAAKYPCSSNPRVSCTNVDGTYYCGNCPSGYDGNGHQCTDINECLTNNGGCSQLVTCTNTDGSRSCGPCPAGYIGDGVTCTYVGICNVNNGGCDPIATCQENSGVPDGRTCTCPSGYTGSGIGNGGCSASGTSCNDNPCVHGRCEYTGSGYICICDPGWTGTNCDVNINDCSTNPCQNGGTCTDDVNGFVCQCPTGWTGDTCTDTSVACGAYLTGLSGSFEFPGEGQAYPHGVSCAWVIDTNDDKVISLFFERFDIEEHPDCNYDFLQINDGSSAAANPIGKYCGSNAPANITSTHDTLYIWFFSDISVNGGGFKILWNARDPVCGGQLIGDNHGNLQSPGYPGDYPVNRDCVWTITVDAGRYITIAFGDLHLESHPSCDYDYLKIIDGLNEADPLLGTYCSSQTPPPVDTTGPYAFIRFHSDASETDTGFQLTYTSSQIDAGCGGALTADSGIIISPNYPNPYNHNQQCIWTIQVPSTEVITLTITDLLIEESTNCVYDYVEIRDGFNENSPFIGRYCRSADIPGPITSSSNTMWILFQSDASINAGGFRATYEVACGGLYTESPGTIVSPYFPNTYPHDKSCEYVITAADGQVVTLTFTFFDIEGHDSCLYDYIEVRDGASDSATLISTLCGNQIPAPITTTGSSMYLKFSTDGSVANFGFSADYEFSGNDGCGGTFTDNTGMFSSPSDGSVYPHGANCNYNIIVDPGLIIELTFNVFNLESHSSCAYDYVEIYDNVTPNVTLLGRYCGATPPPVMMSSSNQMTVLFVSDSSVAFEGFTASYVAVNTSTYCGGTLSGDTGVFSSPNYPNNYPNNRDCVWTINAPVGNQVSINFTDFNLEAHSSCVYDYVTIRNGGYESSPLVGTYCGSSINPTTFISHSHQMRINFHSDASVTATGFSASFDSTATGCGGTLTSPTGSFTSPSYPYAYNHDAFCVWTMSVAQGSQIILTFSDFDVEDHSSCVFDYVKVLDGLDTTSPILGTFCGSTIPEPIHSTGNGMRVEWQSDYSVSGRGFSATYQEDCTEVVLTAVSGYIESPNYPEPYPHNRDCSWIIQSTVGNTINFTFTDLNIESHSTCAYDYVRLVDGQVSTDNELIRLCGTTPVPPGTTYQSTQQYLRVEFHSDSSVATAGFQAYYEIDGCGDQLTGNSGTLSSPNYPDPYDHTRTCEWTITVDPGSSITLTVDNIDVENSVDCTFDSLEIYSGSDSSGFLLKQLCETSSEPQAVSSVGNEMFVRFRTDSSVNGGGFHASYQANPGGCGGNYTSASGSLHSPTVPGSIYYPHYTDCSWTITVDEDHRVAFTFLTFDLEGATDCVFDYVELHDGISHSSPVLAKVCGNALPDPTTYYSTDNKMYVHMYSDGSVSHTGFTASYETACGGRRDASIDGYIQTSNYPNNYLNNQNCSWIIETDDPLDRITLIFTHMDLEANGETDCHDYVTVRQGNSDTSPEVGTYCGSTIPIPITSTGPSLFVSFSSDTSITLTGFRATYSTSESACGGTYTAQSGSIVSPSYPANYPQDTECIWVFTASAGNRVQLSFSIFNLEPVCSQDYVELRQDDASGALIGRYCGNTIPSNVTAVGSLWMKFRSDSQSSGAGFLASYAMQFGGDLSGMSGTIESPLYPSSYPHYASTMWTVTVPAGELILFSYTVMDIENDPACSYDYVKIRDGLYEYSPVLQTACGTEIPSAVQTTGNTGSVQFSSDFSIAGAGFQLNWLAVSGSNTIAPGTAEPGSCGGSLTATSTEQNFTSPGYPNNYLDNQNCVWLITASDGGTIFLNFTSFLLEDGGVDCVFDYVRIYDGATNSDTQLGQFCGSLASPVYSTGSTMRVEFSSDISVTSSGFVAVYKSGCGGDFTSMSGTVTSPGYPANYASNLDCTYNIQTISGATIQLNFQELDVESSSNCGKDQLYLYNGGSETSPALGTSPYCGTTEPTGLETSSNMLRVRLVTDDSGNGRGFSFSYVTVTAGCGGHRTLTSASDTGFISSSNWPNNYVENTECIWIISGPQTHLINGVFDSNFYIESHSSCQFDYVEIRDGGSANAPLIGQYCGNIAPNPVTTTGNAMYVRFSTDFSVTHAGFKMTYSTAVCGGSYSGTSGSFNSPNYPNNYDSSSNCEWYITGPVGHYVTISFSAFNVIGSGDCATGDYIRIHDGRNGSAPVLATYCGSNIPASIDSSDAYVYVVFASNSDSNTGSGFSLQFTASQEECGGDLVSATGSFSSPSYPNEYTHSRVCEWRITVQTGHLINLYFDDFDVEDATGCTFDSVKVYNGLADNSPLLNTLCGSDTPDMISSSGNTMRVVFSTDGSIAGRGFQARYDSNDASVCGGQITVGPGGSGYIFSPQYGLANYSNNVMCEWTLGNSANTNSSLYLTFDDGFDLESHSTCSFDYLQLFEGPDDSGVELERFCGRTAPNPYFIPFQTTFLRFRTDGSVVGEGFRMLYQASGCGGIVSGTSGVITSPNFPNDYNHDDHCAWRIDAPVGETITYTFTSFDIETHPNCGYDYLSIRNGGFPDSPQISGQYPICGSVAPSSFTSSGNQLFIIFKTDEISSGGGFRMEWTTVTNGCGGNFHGSTGTIQTPNYPRNYDANAECVWSILTEDSLHVNLNFDSTYGLGTGDTIEFFDGFDDQAPTLGLFSSSTPTTQISSTNNMMTVKFRSDAATQGVGFMATWTSDCGVEFTDVGEGIIRSPGYPDTDYSNSLNCDYKIIVDATIPLVMNFDEPFDIESHGTCAYDGLRVYSGSDDQGTLLGTYCGTSKPSDFEVTGPVFINFYTDSSVTGSGFRLNFEQGCGGEFTADSGLISTPPHLLSYKNDQNCTWLITVDSSKNVEFKFNTFDLEYHSSCVYDYVQLFDGDDFSTPLTQPLCGATVPQGFFYSTSNTMLINMITDQSVTMAGFSGAYLATYGPSQGCGGTMTTASGTITDFDVDNNGQYENSVDCKTQVILPDINMAVHITFTGSFSIQDSTDCTNDYVEIHDGVGSESPLVGRFCGSSVPDDVTLSGNQAYVVFHTNDAVTSSGFTLQYSSVPLPCGGVFYATTSVQTITTPNYPNNYPVNQRCSWVIDATNATNRVRLETTDFNVEVEDDCTNDYVEFRDQPVGLEGRVLRYCGSSLPPIFDSSGQTVKVYFYSDSSASTTAKGFSLDYSIADCNRNYNQTHGTIMTPGYPRVYSNYHDCSMQITSPVGTFLSLYFNHFDVEAHSSCAYDSVTVYNGSDANAPVIGTYCGDILPSPIFASSNELFIRFITDLSVTRGGFDASFTSSTVQGCGGKLSGRHGSFTSPMHPAVYPISQTCEWMITVPAGGQPVTLSFTTFNIEGTEGVCSEDVLEVYDGVDATATLRGRYCGTSPPADIVASGRDLFVRFTTNAQNPTGDYQYTGFRATYDS